MLNFFDRLSDDVNMVKAANNETYQKKLFFWIIAFSFVAISSCTKAKVDEEPAATSPAAPSSYLYVSSGICYSGAGNTTYTGTTSSNVVYRINTSTGVRDSVLFDYNEASNGDSPVGIANADDNTLYVLVENSITTANRRIEKLAKNGSGSRTNFISNSPNYTPVNGVMKKLVSSPDGGLFIIRNSGTPASAIEKVGSDGVRSGAPFITNAMTGACGTSNTFQDVLSVSNGKVFVASGLASNNRFSLIPSTGYGSCLAGQSAPTANSYPTAMAYVSSASQLIVAYSGNSVTTDINSIYVYDINETSNTITNATKLYDATTHPVANYGNLYGISSMAFDPESNSLYVAASTGLTTTITNHNYAIEKFTYNPSSKTLTRATSGTPFFTSGFETKCISSMIIAK